MTVFTPTRPTVSHFYKYKSAENLEWLKPLLINHGIYIPSVAQLNDPIDCRPKITPMSDEEMAGGPGTVRNLLAGNRFAAVRFVGDLQHITNPVQIRRTPTGHDGL